MKPSTHTGEAIMFTRYYNGMYINGHFNKNECYITDDFNTFSGKTFKSYRSAQIAITKAINAGAQVSRY